MCWGGCGRKRCGDLCAKYRGPSLLLFPCPATMHFAQAAEKSLRVSSDNLIRIVALCVVLACAETLHGIARIKLLIPRIGKERAVKLSALTGTLLAFIICWLLVPGLHLLSPEAHIALGLVLAGFMASFDIAIGRWLMRKAWGKIWPDFNPKTGNYLLYALIALCLIPLLVWHAKRL